MAKSTGAGRARLLDRANYILLPETAHGKDEYGRIYVAAHRLAAEPFVVRHTEEGLGFKVNNTGREKCGKRYIGDVIWEDALKLNLLLNGETLSIRRFIDFEQILEDGIRGTDKVYDGRGKRIRDVKELRSIYDEVFEVRTPSRGEFLDAKFVPSENGIEINYSHSLNRGKLVAGKREKLELGLMEKIKISKYNFNRRSLPVIEAEIYFYPPSMNSKSVAGFGAGSDGMYLFCFGNPSGTVASLGVRHARKNFDFGEEK